MDQGIADVGDARAELENTASAFHAANLGPIREELAIADANVGQAAATEPVMAAQVAKLSILAPQMALLHCLSRSWARRSSPASR